MELSRVLNAKDMKVSEKLAFISHLVGSSDPREIRFYDRLRKSNSISDDEVESAAPLFTRKSIWAPASPVFSFIDLFAGIGGMRIAAEQAGGKCVFSSEWDPFAKMTYLANFGVIPFGDITKISASDVPKYDVLLAGFPCQTFSSAGLKAGFEDTRGTMFFEHGLPKIHATGRRPQVVVQSSDFGQLVFPTATKLPPMLNHNRVQFWIFEKRNAFHLLDGD